MFKGENLIGVLLAGLCLIIAGVMIWAMATDRELTYNGPSWLPWILMVVILGGSLWGMAQRFRGRGGNGVGGGAQWPNPNTGQKSLLDRARGKKDDQPS
jgi:hypothetical protein